MKLLHQDAPPGALNFFIKWIAGIWLVSIIFDPLPIIAHLPTSIFHPAGFMLRALPEFVQHFLITAPALHALKILTIVSLVLVILNRALRPAAVLACILITAYQGIVRGFGHINHAEIAPLYALYFITLFSFADGFIKKSERASYPNLSGIPIVASLAFMLFGFTFIGIYRMLAGGVELFMSDSLTHYFVHNSHRGSLFIVWDLDDLVLKYRFLHLFFKIGFPIITIFEILAPFCLVSNRFRYVFNSVIIPFLILNWFFMNVLFWQDMLLAILLFDFTHRFAREKASEQVGKKARLAPNTA